MKKKMSNYKNSLMLNILPILLIPILFLITSNEIIISILFFLFGILTLSINYQKNEWKVFVVGIILGVIVEIGGDLIFKMQYWENGSFFGVPIWLPIAWGYAFIHIRRIGNLIISIKKILK